MSDTETNWKETIEHHANGSLTCHHLFQSLALTEARYPNCGLLVTGDCNRLNIHVFLNYFLLKQIVKVLTRKKATLDLILNKMHEYYSPPQACPTFGLSDHTAIVGIPKDGRHNINSKKPCQLREENLKREILRVKDPTPKRRKPKKPSTEILNASCPEQHLPTIYKIADVIPLPKDKPVLDIKKELRPIVSMMPCVSEVAEFVAGGLVKPAVMSVLDDNQYEKGRRQLVTSTRLLGLTIANDLPWDHHVTEITKKAILVSSGHTPCHNMVNGFLELAMHPAPWLCAIFEDFVLVVVAQ
ncbi:hypothetical protein P5673_028118 [Acropora cervicornis]|uniref:Uncharacterized protein n=1 Tax=Acropora cervicornis TaxID=6130 RepID=A0AAD9UVF0_ACRCE|nr:hypothetical protein P5673_028118 [Acropora cervicornis]